MKEKPFWKKFHRKKPWWASEAESMCHCECGHSHRDPAATAWRSLIEHLNPRQLKQFNEKRYFTVRGKTRRWRLHWNGEPPVEVWLTKADAKEVGVHEYGMDFLSPGWFRELCVDVAADCYGAYDYMEYPEGDKLLALKLAIEADDERFYKVAVTHELSEWHEPQTRKTKPRRRPVARRRRRRGVYR